MRNRLENQLENLGESIGYTFFTLKKKKTPEKSQLRKSSYLAHSLWLQSTMIAKGACGSHSCCTRYKEAQKEDADGQLASHYSCWGPQTTSWCHPKSREGEGTNPLLLNTHKHVQGCASVVILTFIKLTIRANHDRPQEHRAGGL